MTQVPNPQPSRKCKNNVKLQSNNRVIGSMNVAALYPNCKSKESSANIERAVKRCGLLFRDIDKEYLVKYVKYSLMKDYQRTLNVLKDIANSLDPNIQIEADYPSGPDSMRVPVLITKFSIHFSRSLLVPLMS